MYACDIFYITNKSGDITPSNFKNVLTSYYAGEGLTKENGGFWSSSQGFNQSNYLMSALMINITYLCCAGADKNVQECNNNDVNLLLKSVGVKDNNKVLAHYDVAMGYRKVSEMWFATIGLIEGTDLGIISWRGTQGTDDWIADFSPGFQHTFKTCQNNTLTDEELSKSDGCKRRPPPFFKEYIDKNPNYTNSYPLAHSTMLEIYDNSYVKSGDKYYTVYGAVKDLYPSTTKWIVTGHSLGAALAELCSADLASRGVKINSVYMFANPSPGNDIYRGIYNNLSDNYNGKTLKNIAYNIKNTNDLVVNVNKFYQPGRTLVGNVKKFVGSGSKSSPSGIGVAHSMEQSYIIDGIKEFFGKSGDLTKYVTKESYKKSLRNMKSKSSNDNTSKKMLYISIFIILVVILICIVSFMIIKKRS